MLVYHIIDVYSSHSCTNGYVQLDVEVKRDDHDRTERIHPVLTSTEYHNAVKTNTIVLN